MFGRITSRLRRKQNRKQWVWAPVFHHLRHMQNRKRLRVH
jgi:hypothetical protein